MVEIETQYVVSQTASLSVPAQLGHIFDLANIFFGVFCHFFFGVFCHFIFVLSPTESILVSAFLSCHNGVNWIKINFNSEHIRKDFIPHGNVGFIGMPRIGCYLASNVHARSSGLILPKTVMQSWLMLFMRP